MSPLGRSPTRAEQAADAAAEPDQALRGQRRQHVVGARQRGGAQQEVDLAAEPAAGDEHEPLGALGELVGELHRDAAAERVPDDRHALVAERGDDVARAAGVRAERVVAARRGRLAVAEQVGRDQREALAEQRRDALPRLRRVGDPVQQQQRGPAAGGPVAHPLAVELQLVALEGHPGPHKHRAPRETGPPRQMEGRVGPAGGATPRAREPAVIPVTQSGREAITVPFKRLAIVNRGEAAMRAINAVRELNEENDEQIR